jgi:hypothetical protein
MKHKYYKKFKYEKIHKIKSLLNLIEFVIKYY